MKKTELSGGTIDYEPLPAEPCATPPWITSATRFIDRLLMLPTSTFWSTLTERFEILNWLDDVIGWFPRLFGVPYSPCSAQESFSIDNFRPYELDRLRALDVDGDVLASVRLLKGSSLALFLRIAVHDRERDPSLPPADWLRKARIVLPLRRFALWLSPFAPPHDERNKRNREIFAKTLKLWMNMEGCRSSEDMIHLEGKHVEELVNLKKDIDRIAGAWTSSRGLKRASLAEIILQFLEGSVDWLYGALAFYRVAEAAKLRCRPAKLVPEIASMVERFSALLTTQNAQELAIHLCDYPLRRVLRLRTQLMQFGVELVYELLMVAAAEKRAAIVSEVLYNESFLCALNDRHKIEDIVAKGTLTQKEDVKKSMEAAQVKREKMLLNELGNVGLTKDLGEMALMNQRVAAAVDEVLGIFPNLSTPFVHACLRHCGYDAAEAVDMIVSERVPGVLRRLEDGIGKQKWFEKKNEMAASTTLPPLIFDHEEVDLVDVVKASTSRSTAENAVKADKIKEQQGPNLFKGMFSLALEPKKKETKEEEEEEDVGKVALAKCRQASEKALSEIRLTIERMKKRVHGEDAAFGMENEQLIAMKGSKSHATADKYKTSAEDKASLRPFYDRFKFETDDRDDLYDDEYDDGYEEKAFAAEPLNNDLASSDEEKKKSEEVEERSKAENRRGGGRISGAGRGASAGAVTRGGAAAGAGWQQQQQPAAESQRGGGAYTGGRQRQVQERNKNKFRQRGADRKTRGLL